MKNKKIIQAENRKKHKKRLLDAKKRKRRQEPELERKKPKKPKKAKFLIICEGQNTEISYFKRFKLTYAEIEPIGEGYNTTSLINRAIFIIDQKKKQGKKFDQIWVVFDKDDFSDFKFNKAIEIAKKNKIKVAFSNQGFEYWLILHFQDNQGGKIHRKRYGKILNKHLTKFDTYFDYKKSKLINDDIFDLLLSKPKNRKRTRQKNAIIRANKIFNEKKHLTPAKTESCTTVFKLIKQLERYK